MHERVEWSEIAIEGEDPMPDAVESTNSEGAITPATTEPDLLAVDDDPIQRDLYGIYLAAAGFRVVTAETAEAALLELDRADFVGAVVDYDMPGMDGVELIHRLRADPRFADRPVLVVTGREDLVSVQRVMQAGASGMVVKPVDWRALATRVRILMGAAAAER